MLVESADGSLLKTDVDFGGRIPLGIKEPFPDGPAAERVAVKALAKAFLTFLRQKSEVEMALKKLGFAFDIAQFFCQERTHWQRQAAGRGTLVEPVRCDLIGSRSEQPLLL